jgi:hypothetical protein
MKMKKFILLTIVATTVFLACKKDPVVNSGNLTLTNGNLAGDYKWTGSSFTEDSSTVQNDVYGYDTLTPPCRKDNIFTFTLDGKYNEADSGLVCLPTANTSSTYSINSATNLVYDGKLFLVQNLTTTQLIIGRRVTVPAFPPFIPKPIAGLQKLTFTRIK